jgi:MarR family 2-MHQ and catechol resistance regulon transcriptional repressor
VPDYPIRVGEDFTQEFPGASRSATEVAANLVHCASMLLDTLNRHRAQVTSLSPSASEVLAVIDGAGEPLPGSEIARRLLVSTASMTSLVDTLERRGLVRRIPHREDRRKVLIDITDEGRSIVDTLLPVMHAANREAVEPLTERERDSLVTLLAKLQRHLADGVSTVPPSPESTASDASRRKPGKVSRS